MAVVSKVQAIVPEEIAPTTRFELAKARKDNTAEHTPACNVMETASGVHSKGVMVDCFNDETLGADEVSNPEDKTIDAELGLLEPLWLDASRLIDGKGGGRTKIETVSAK